MPLEKINMEKKIQGYLKTKKNVYIASGQQILCRPKRRQKYDLPE